jgi:Bacterial protein of unknown function (DUF885)
MGQPPTGLTPKVGLDRFFESYYRLRPVTATFTGVHDFDQALPDWSPTGLTLAIGEMKMLRRSIGAIAVAEPPQFPDQVDVALADAFLEIQIAEHESPHFYRGNPAIWTGEAIFSVLSLVTRDFAPLPERLASATARLQALPGFLDSARETLVTAPAAWKEKALREVQGGNLLLGASLLRWISQVAPDTTTVEDAQRACIDADKALSAFGRWIGKSLRTAPDARYSAGTAMLEMLLARGHWERRSIEELLLQATGALTEATAELDERAGASGCRDWADAQSQLATLHPTREGYLARFAEIWERARASALAHDLVTWPDAPIRYVPIPEHTREAAPLLYYLFYRSPATFDRSDVYDYVVTPIDDTLALDEQQRRLRAANDSVITLNHVIHHGGIGHHVQNWNAYRSASRIGQVAAIDAASRIAMFSGGSLAEGWACYVCDVMEEVGFLTPLERVAQQHTRVRLLARAVADLSLHTGRMSLDETAQFYVTSGMMPEVVARAEAVKNSMFPGAAVMYWLGAQGIHDLRRKLQARQGASFSLKRFHDQLLSYGAIPVALISRLMLEES